MSKQVEPPCCNNTSSSQAKHQHALSKKASTDDSTDMTGTSFSLSDFSDSESDDNSEGYDSDPDDEEEPIYKYAGTSACAALSGSVDAGLEKNSPPLPLPKVSYPNRELKVLYF